MIDCYALQASAHHEHDATYLIPDKEEEAKEEYAKKLTSAYKQESFHCVQGRHS